MNKIILFLTSTILAVTTSANASTYRDVTEQYINKQGSSWKWSDFQNIKQVKWEFRTPKSFVHNGRDVYYLEGSLSKPDNKINWIMFNVDGVKTAPTKLSLQAVAEDDSLLSEIMPSLFNPVNLTEIKSSCTRKNYNPQSFYKWSKSGYAPLYIINSSDYTRFGIYYNVNIHQSFDEMVEYVNNSGDGPLLLNDNIEKVESCYFNKI